MYNPTCFADIICNIHKIVTDSTNLVIDDPVRYKRRKHQNNFANNFDFVNSTVMKATTMSNFSIVEETWYRLWWTTEIQHVHILWH